MNVVRVSACPLGYKVSHRVLDRPEMFIARADLKVGPYDSPVGRGKLYYLPLPLGEGRGEGEKMPLFSQRDKRSQASSF